MKLLYTYLMLALALPLSALDSGIISLEKSLDFVYKQAVNADIIAKSAALRTLQTLYRDLAEVDQKIQADAGYKDLKRYQQLYTIDDFSRLPEADAKRLVFWNYLDDLNKIINAIQALPENQRRYNEQFKTVQQVNQKLMDPKDFAKIKPIVESVSFLQKYNVKAKPKYNELVEQVNQVRQENFTPADNQKFADLKRAQLLQGAFSKNALREYSNINELKKQFEQLSQDAQQQLAVIKASSLLGDSYKNRTEANTLINNLLQNLVKQYHRIEQITDNQIENLILRGVSPTLVKTVTELSDVQPVENANAQESLLELMKKNIKKQKHDDEDDYRDLAYSSDED